MVKNKDLQKINNMHIKYVDNSFMYECSHSGDDSCLPIARYQVFKWTNEKSMEVNTDIKSILT